MKAGDADKVRADLTDTPPGYILVKADIPRWGIYIGGKYVFEQKQYGRNERLLSALLRKA